MAFDADLRAIRAQISSMGQLVGQQIADATAALVGRDTELARSVIARDATVDAMLNAIETKVIETVAQRQPLAIDLREVIGAFHISHDLERAGDLAKGISKRVLALDADLPKPLVAKLQELSALVVTCLKRVLDSYIEHDDVKAADVWNRDQQVDEVQNALFGEILLCMMSDPRNISSCTHLLFCTKNLERMGDHATNMSESVHFIVTGDRFVGDRPRAANLGPALAPH
jgi:phosphate transport system protein